ncbi:MULTISPECIES: pantetheine-phosphate adenylyltransferase [Helcococcus]|uniref:Phosphopantetheine adenylyltransferase n=1 Tax=Helcococcus bovis TaxID=3153252 RepID=A0ABW9F6A5_9FIRM
MKVVYPGSFDPVTNGHIDIIKRASKLFGEVVVCVLVNNKKKYLFNMEERIEMLEELLYDYDNVKVCMYSGLLIDFVEKNKIDSIIRGIRAISDYESELQFAQMNKFYSITNVETVFMVAEPEMSYLSSSIVKEIASFNGDVSRLVPKNVEIKIKEKFK